jgi:N-methylhydantoinase B
MYYIKKEFLVDSGGPGKNRGGLGQEVEFCILDNKEQDNYVETSVRLSGRTEKGTFPVSGMMGGQKGRGSGMWIDGKEVDHGIYRRLKPNSVVKFIISGGGGFGDSYKRDPSKVLNDVKKGYVSIIAAKRDYGVIIDKKTLTLNKQSTAKLRKQKNVQK